MRTSLPQLFKKDLNSINTPERQGGVYSLYLRTNNFDINNYQSNIQKKSKLQSNHNLKNRLNKSVNLIQNQNNKIYSRSTFKNDQNNSYKNLLTNRKKQSHSKSVFLQQNSFINQQQQASSFKVVRKQVLSQFVLIQKSVQIIKRQESNIKSDLCNLKKQTIQNLDDFERKMLKQIALLHRQFRTLRKQIIMQIKVNKEQINLLNQQIKEYKIIQNQFQQKQKILRLEITNQIQSNNNI